MIFGSAVMGACSRSRNSCTDLIACAAITSPSAWSVTRLTRLMYIDLRSKKCLWGKAHHRIAMISSHRPLCSAVSARRASLTYPRESIPVIRKMRKSKDFTGVSRAMRLLTMRKRGTSWRAILLNMKMVRSRKRARRHSAILTISLKTIITWTVRMWSVVVQ